MLMVLNGQDMIQASESYYGSAVKCKAGVNACQWRMSELATPTSTISTVIHDETAALAGYLQLPEAVGSAGWLEASLGLPALHLGHGHSGVIPHFGGVAVGSPRQKRHTIFAFSQTVQCGVICPPHHFSVGIHFAASQSLSQKFPVSLPQSTHGLQ